MCTHFAMARPLSGRTHYQEFSDFIACISCTYVWNVIKLKLHKIDSVKMATEFFWLAYGKIERV